MNFHNILKVYRRDWRSIITNPVAIIIIAGLCIIPSLYAWINIKACWNVYENTGDIPVAVVNNDKPANFNGKTINIGNSVVDELKKNNKIHWVFVNSKEADLGLADSTYYAVIEIPEDFSAKFLTVLSDNPQKPQITYKADTKVNPVAGKITETAKDNLVQEITSNFVSTVNQTVFSSLNTVGKDANGNRDNLLQMKDAIVKINSGMTVITDSLQTIHTGSDNVSQLLDSVSTALPTIQSGLQVVAKNNTDNQAIIQSTKTSLNDSINNLDLNLNYAQTSNTRIQSLFANLNEAVAQGNSQKINTIVPGISAELDSMDNAIDSTIDYLEEYKSIDFNSDIETMITSLQNLKASLATLRQQLVTMQTQIENSKQDLDALYDYLDTAIPQLEQQLDSLDQSLTTIIGGLEDLNQTMNNPAIAQLITDLKAIQSSGLKDTLISTLEAIKNSRDSVEAALSSLDSAITTMIQTIDTATKQINATVSFLKSTETLNTDKKEDLNKIISSLEKIQPYLEDEKTQFGSIQQQLNKTNAISKNIADTINSDAGKINTQLTSALLQYHSGAKDDLNAMADSLTTATKDAADLIQSAQGLSTQLSNMVQTAQNGSQLASSFSTDLNKRLLEFKDVISLLSSKLELVGNDDVAQIISILQSNPQFMGNFMSDPFDLKTESINAIPNYGSSMAPIYTTLALWVGCLLLNSILKPKVGHFEGEELLTLRERHFGKMMLFVALAMIQGLIVSLGDLFILHVYAVNGFLFVMFCVVSSMVFSIITFTLMSTLGNIGKALSIIYMILQLAGSGGTYPIQVDPLFFRIFQPLFPFTYTVGGIREAIAGPLVSSVVQDFVLLFLFGAVFLLFGFFAIESLHSRIHRFEEKFRESGIGE